MAAVDLDDYDTAQPRLSVCNEAAIIMMGRRPYDKTWDHILSTLDVLTLFKVGLRSHHMFEVVTAYVQAHAPPTYNTDEYRTGAVGDSMSKLPLDLFPLIFSELTFSDRLTLSRSSKKLRALCARENQASVSRLLRKFGLCPVDIRFMQSATRTTISGVAIVHLINANVFPHTIEFHTPQSTYSWVLRFLALASPYHGRPQHDVYFNDGVAHITKFLRPTSEVILVMKSRTDSALDIIPHAPFTNMFVAATHYGMWLGYPKTTLSGLSFPSRDMMQFGDPRTQYRIRSILRDYVDTFCFKFSLNRPHTCGLTFECPVTPRTTIDDGCLSLFFPGPPFGRQAEPVCIYPSDTALSWSLDARGCRLGMRRVPQAINVMRRDDGFDRISKPSLYLVNSQYNVDFVATRDRTTPAGALWTFKTIEDDDVYILSSVKTCLGAHLTHVFGQVDEVKETKTGFIVRLRCPEEVSCLTRHKYGVQLARLQETLDGEQAYAPKGGDVVSSWFFTSAQGEPCPPEANHFYVRVSAYVANSICVAGDVIEMVAYSLSALTFLAKIPDTNAICLYSGEDDLHSISPCINPPDADQETSSIWDYIWKYAVGSKVEVWVSLQRIDIGAQSNNTARMLRRMRAMASWFLNLAMDYPPLSEFLDPTEYGTVASSRLFEDFAPTRDKSLGTSSIFTYKAMAHEYEGSTTERGTLEMFAPTLFGEIDLIQSSPSLLRLRCPSMVKCSVKALYAEQIAVLREPLVMDDTDLGGLVANTWFERAGIKGNCEDACIYVHLRDFDESEWTYGSNLFEGQLVGMWVTLRRVDCVVAGQLSRTYELNSDFFTPITLSPDECKGKNYIHRTCQALQHLHVKPHIVNMLARFRGENSLVVARAEYDKDFAAVRKRTLDGGCLYLYKEIAHDENSGNYGCKGSLWNYVGYVFGELDLLYTTATTKESVLRLKCPAGASCEVTRLFDEQDAVLKKIIAAEDETIGGLTVRSYLDYHTIDPILGPVDGCFYVSGDLSGFAQIKLPTHNTALIKVSFSRHDTHNAETQLVERLYQLDVWTAEFHSQAFIPSRLAPGYVCDMNGSIGCSICTNGALCAARYGRDFVATWDRTDQGACIYTFKAVEEDPWWLRCERKQVARVLPSVVFGEVKNVLTMIQCPSGITCDAQTSFYKQLRTLRDIVKIDLDVTVMLEAVSAQEAAELKAVFCDANVVGLLMKLNVTMQRRESTELSTVKKTASHASGLDTPAIVQESLVRSADVVIDTRPANLFFFTIMSLPNLRLASATAVSSTMSSRIPPEIWSSIFFLSVDPTRKDWVAVVNARRVIQLVSRPWRNIACGFPLLWSNIRIKRFMSPAFVKNCLLRAGQTADLFVEIDGENHTTIAGSDNLSVRSVPLGEFCRVVLEPLGPVFNRVTKLSLEGVEDDDVRKLMGTMSEWDGRKLHTLELLAANPRARQVTPVSVPKGSTLANMTLDGVVPWWNTNDVSSRFLTKLVLAYMDDDLDLQWTRLREALEACVALEDLCLVDVACIDWEDEPAVVLPNVTRFQMAYSDDQYCAYARNIAAPALRSLHLFARSYGSLKDLQPIVPVMLASAKEVLLSTQVYASGDVDVVFLCSSATLINIRGCPESATYDLLKRARESRFLPPSMQRLEMGVFVEEEFIVQLLEGLGDNLTIVGPRSRADDQGRVEWRLRDGALRSQNTYPLYWSQRELRVPTEVLEQIFFRAIDPTSPVWFDALNSLLAIASVCRRWQAIVREQRGLWRNVTVARCMTEDWIKTALDRLGPSTFALRIDARPYRGIRVGEGRGSRAVSSRTMTDFVSNVLPRLSHYFVQVQALVIEGLEERSLASILHAISNFPSTALRDLTIECTVSVVAEASLVLPLVGQVTRLKLREFRPLWTSPEFYQAITVVDLGSTYLDLKWSQLRIALGAMLALTDLRVTNVSCAEWYDGPPLHLPHLTNFHLAYGGLSNIEWLRNLVVDEIITFGLHLSVGASIVMAVTWVPHICGVARHVRLDTLDLTGPEIPSFWSLFRSATSFDTRPSTHAFTQLARFLDAPNPELIFPRLEVLLIVGEVTIEEARTMLVGRFARLRLVHAKVSRKGYIKDYVEWTVENQEVVQRYVQRD
ncbi:hypothetical protein B0H13DRAFT_1908812 [Mycena leptocephala]|nr:hypothetical protein B0H13DRAFT_1908812 [Mycena leptocephala]